MNILKKVVPFRMRHGLAVLCIAGAAFAACTKQEPIVQHDTVYTWGRLDDHEIWPADNVCASADSAEVRYVILKADGGNWFRGRDEYEIKTLWLDPVIEAVDPSKRHKLRGAGELRRVKAADPDARKWLEDFGYTFTEYDDVISSYGMASLTKDR